MVISVVVAGVIISAAEQVVYVNQSAGNDTNDGLSQNTAFKTLDAAFKKLATDGGTIVLTSDYNLSTHYETPEYKGQVTITSKQGNTDFGGRLRITGECIFRLHGDTVFKDVKVYQSYALTFVANYNPILFDDGFTVQSSTSNKNVSVVGGYWEPKDSSLKNDLDSNITVNSGDFNYLLGFTRKKGTATQDYTGTSHITLNGGTVTKIYGGTSENHYGGSTVITVNGGTVTQLYAAGDVTRRLKGSATITLNGGKVGTLDINNVMGDARLNIVGSAPSSVKVSYASDALKNDEEKEASIKSVNYNSLVCSQALINSFAQHFDLIENSTVVFVKANGTGDGAGADKAIGSLSDAYNKLKVDGGKILVVGEVAYDIATVGEKFGGEITISGQDDKSALTFAAGQTAAINTDTTFENIKFKSSGAATLYANFHELTLDTTVTSEGALTLVGSSSGAGTGDVSMIINGGTYSAVVGVDAACGSFSGKANVVLGDVKTDKATLSTNANAKLTNATLSVSAGEHKSIVVCEAGSVTADLTVNLLGGKITDTKLNGAEKNFLLNLSHVELVNEIKVEGLSSDKSARTFVLGMNVDESKLAQVKANFPEAEQENSVYVMTGGTGTGRSPDSPVGNLNDAIKLLGGEGKVVICGEYNVTTTVQIDAHTYPITITSVGTGVDFRDSGAKINFAASIQLGGETTIEKINFTNSTSSSNIYAMANKLVIGEEVETELINANTYYVNIIGGRHDNILNKKTDVTINSGDWGVVRAGSNGTGLYESGVEISLTVNGGTFHRYMALASRGNNSDGKINFTANGGTYYQSIYAVYEEENRMYAANYDVTVTLNDGTFYQMIAPACSFTTKINGTYTVNLNGGNYAHLTDLLGSELFEGNMTSTLNIADGIDINAEEKGTDTFTNPVRGSGPDPWVFYYDGNYYYTHTTGSKIVLMKVANISDIDTSAERVIIEPTEGQNMWSPEIHHFSAEEVGEENAGWYLYIGFDDGTTANQRQHVLKCLDGDNLLGRWGDPVTGKINVPRKVEVPNAPHYNNDELCGGSSKIVINGKTYMTFVSEVGRGTEGFHQTINITEIENPWTYKSVPTTICVPEYGWEMGGYGYSATVNDGAGGWYPKVVEGASAVYSDNGDVYLMYTGSGYWTIYYQLGFLKFMGGDPMDANNWKKNPTSVLSLSNEVNGCGHGSYFKDHEGNYYVAYHGYLGTDTSSGRYAHVERIYVTSDGIKIGNGTGHPAPLSTEYTISLNPASLASKISGFEPITDGGNAGDGTPDTGNTDGGQSGGIDTTVAIIIIVAAVVVVGAGVAAFLVIDGKKSAQKKAAKEIANETKNNDDVQEKTDKNDNE